MRPLATLLATGLLCAASLAQGNPVASPQLHPFAGDPRLEPIAASPQHFANHPAFAEGRQVEVRFPPRVNGQSVSDGDGHADLYYFVDVYTGQPIPGQLPVVEAVPKGAAPAVTDLVARNFSAIWEVSVVTLGPGYDPNDPLIRIDSALKLANSRFVEAIYVTNMHLNCPVVPMGSTTDPGGPDFEHAWFDGTTVALLPYDLEDGISHPQVLFKFEDAAGNTLPNDSAPHMVLSRLPGMPFYSPIWEVWTVQAPSGYPYQSLRSRHDIEASRLPIRAANVRLNCPVVAVETAVGSGQLQPVDFEDAELLLRNDFSQGTGAFREAAFKIDVPEGMCVQVALDAQGEPVGQSLAPSPFHRRRGFRVTTIEAAADIAAPEAPPFGAGAFFPKVASVNGNFVPLILRYPFATTQPGLWPRVSSPDDTGERIRFSQRDLDKGFLKTNPPQLPAAIERNVAEFIRQGLMDPSWAPGQRPYIERLALVGRALHEFVWRPEDGQKTLDTTSCVACHQSPAAGSGSRGLYTMEVRAGLRGDGEVLDTVNGGSMWGSALAEMIVQDRRRRGLFSIDPHAATGDRDTIRHFTSKAQFVHFGLQSSEDVMEQTGWPLRTAQRHDQDRDGVAEEATVGEISAQAAFLLSLPSPTEILDPDVMARIGATPTSVDNGRRLFRAPIHAGGVGCAACHTPFLPLPSTTFVLTNPETRSQLSFPIDAHTATALDVAEGYATAVGQPGARLYGDLELHKMGSPMRSIGRDAPDVLKTAELWDVGSTAPYLRDGSAGMDLRQAILRHGGVTRTDVTQTRGPQTQISPTRRQQTIVLRNQGAATIAATPERPIRLVLAGLLLPGTASAANAHGLAPDGGRRHGAYWNLEQPIPPGGEVTIDLVFESPSEVTYSLLVQDFDGFSEGAASTLAFSRLRANDQKAILDFLGVQTILGLFGEGGPGVIVVEPAELPDLGG